MIIDSKTISLIISIIMILFIILISVWLIKKENNVMLFQIKKFLSNKLSILNEDLRIQKSKNGLYYLIMTEIRN